MRSAARTLALAITCASLVAPASAQPQTQAASVSAESVVRRLEAQYIAVVIRERRIAEERERRLIVQAEERVRELTRADLSVAGAAADLDSARARYENLVAESRAREAALLAEIETYRSEVQQLVQRASPELLEAYQRFANGDRIGTWPEIRQLAQAEAQATMSGARARAAAVLREAARAGHVMWRNNELSAAEALELWDQVANLEPTSFATTARRVELLQSVGDFTSARTVIDRAIEQLEPARRTVLMGLFTQYQAALIRERRLADDLEGRLIADAESRLTRARTAADGARSDASAIQTELADAREAYTRLIDEIVMRDTTSSHERNQFLSEAGSMIETATPEYLAALQRMADGDRAGAWQAIEAETQARVRARLAAAEAEELLRRERENAP